MEKLYTFFLKPFSKNLLTFLFFILFTSLLYPQPGWDEIETNNPPSERAKHSLVTMPDGQIVMFGGEGREADLFNDLYVFQENDYTPVETNNPPEARKYNGYWEVDGDLYIYGGLNSNGEVLNDMWKYDTEVTLWFFVEADSLGARYYSLTVAFEDGEVMISSGTNNEKATLYDTWLYDPATGTFEQKPDCPFPSYDQRGAVFGNKLYLLQMHGNLDKMTYFDRSLEDWVIFEPDANSPTPGWTQSAAHCNAGENGMFVIGGEVYIPGEGYQISDTVWQFTPENHQWNIYGHLPVKLKFLAAAYDTPNDRIIIFGGIDENGNYTNKTYELRFTPVSVNEENNLPKEFILEQNYPNPFNPATTINYSIPEISNVVIKVYDILGKEIVALVNEEKPAGNHSVNFDAADLASGIYFYRIKANSFVETKSMILMK